VRRGEGEKLVTVLVCQSGEKIAGVEGRRGNNSLLPAPNMVKEGGGEGKGGGTIIAASPTSRRGEKIKKKREKKAGE